MKNSTNTNVQSLERALILLEKLSENPDGCSIKRLTELTSLHKSTVHRLLHTLANYGYTYQDDSTERYHLGYKPLALSNALLESMDIRSIARPFLKELCDLSGETVHLQIQNGAYAVYIDKVENHNRAISMYSQIGKRIPMYCSAGGKALLAWQSEDRVRSIVGEQPFKCYTKNTIGDIDTLLKELAQIRSQGYAVDWFEHEDNIFCIASPVFGSTNQVVAAVSLSGILLQTADTPHFAKYPVQVDKAAHQISMRLGCTRYPVVFNAPDVFIAPQR